MLSFANELRTFLLSVTYKSMNDNDIFEKHIMIKTYNDKNVAECNAFHQINVLSVFIKYY